MKPTSRLLPVAVVFVLAASLALTAEKPPEPSATRECEMLFVESVLPLLKAKCFACHGDDANKRKGDLDLRTRDAMLKGGKSKTTALVPGDPGKSLLYQAVTRDGK